MPKLYLIPTFLAEQSKVHIPPIIGRVLTTTNTYIVERLRTSRRFIKSVDKGFNIDAATFVELDKHDFQQSISDIKELFRSNEDIGLMSEAGTPCIADPGAQIVNIARKYNYQIVPLTGPSSIILGLMASGMNGQHFTFHGYLPIKDKELHAKLKTISDNAQKSTQAHIFIETPYRNKKLISTIKKHVASHLFLSASIDLTGINEKIITKKVKDWEADWLDKTPAIFCLGQLMQ